MHSNVSVSSNHKQGELPSFRHQVASGMQLKKSVLVPVLSLAYLAFLMASVLCVIFEW
eukprot:COSAG04_NODE_1548_length_6381_cov_42.332697_3_plen_58_part_00